MRGSYDNDFIYVSLIFPVFRFFFKSIADLRFSVHPSRCRLFGWARTHTHLHFYILSFAVLLKNGGHLPFVLSFIPLALNYRWSFVQAITHSLSSWHPTLPGPALYLTFVTLFLSNQLPTGSALCEWCMTITMTTAILFLSLSLTPSCGWWRKTSSERFCRRSFFLDLTVTDVFRFKFLDEPQWTT